MPASICGLDIHLTIAYVNRAWVAFAKANGPPSSPALYALGADVLAVCPPSLRDYHQKIYAEARAGGVPVEHDYECSSASHERIFRMRVHPCPSGALVVVHSMMRETVHHRAPSAALESVYRDRRGVIVQCSNCRRVRRPGNSGHPEGWSWDWVPEYVADMPKDVSHGICAVCFEYYYPA